MSADSKVIRPPIDDIASGKVFRPSRAFRNKMWFLLVSAAVLIWLSFVLLMTAVGYLVFVVAGLDGWPAFWNFVNVFWFVFNFWYWIITAIWLVPGLIFYPIYINAIEYSVIAKSGEVMPEIYVKKGIINITRKHVPFRTITNISSRAGPFDRLFGIGSIEVETAGQSGATYSAEEKLEGLEFYEELRDFILRELRRFKDPYVTGTEVVLPEDEKVIRVGGGIEEEILRVLEDIRRLLRERG
ncbi:MAG: PH domain-containing protein [Candidatus Hodarchaeota archaeon]